MFDETCILRETSTFFKKKFKLSWNFETRKYELVSV